MANLGEDRMPDMFFLSAPGAALVHSLRASLGTERAMMPGRATDSGGDIARRKDSSMAQQHLDRLTAVDASFLAQETAV